jgi:PAS domain S-box-containing protein
MRTLWWPSGVRRREASPEFERAYRAEIERTHAPRARVSYAIFFVLGLTCSALEYSFFPERLVPITLAALLYAATCLGTMWAMSARPEHMMTATIVGNNVLSMVACGYYAAAGAAAETCALSLVLFMLGFLFFGGGGGWQFLSCLGAMTAYPLAIANGSVATIPVAYSAGAVVLTALMTSARAALIDAQRFAAFHRGEALRGSEANLRGIFDNLRDVFFRINRRGIVEMISPSVSRFGFTPEELIGRHARELYTDAARFRAVQGQLIETTGGGGFELVIPDRSGHLVPVSINAHVRVDPDGAFAGIEGIIRDVTERKRAEDEVRQRQAQLAHVARLSTLGEMAAGVAHELHQPLAAIVNFTSGCERRLRTDGTQPPEILHALGQISAQALRAGEIIRRIRQFIRKEEPSFEWIDVNTLIRNVRQLCEADAQSLGVDLRLELAATLPRIRANGIQIEQVLLNLIRNGFEAMESLNGRPKRLEIRTAATDTDIEIAVSDSGRGLPSELLDRAFEPFFSTKSNGIGLGLGISRSIVEEHGGRLLAKAGSGRGATFRFTLPIAHGPA